MPEHAATTAKTMRSPTTSPDRAVRPRRARHHSRRLAGLNATVAVRRTCDDIGLDSARFHQMPETGNRKFVVIDLDNVTGMRDLKIWEWRLLLQGIRTALDVTDSDEMIISMCRHTMSQAMVALAETSAQLLVKDGPDGAEMAIAEVLDVGHVATRHATLVIVSGDHFFTGLTHDAHRHGMHVQQVCSNRAGCSTILRRAVDTHRTLDVDQLITGDGRLTGRVHALAS